MRTANNSHKNAYWRTGLQHIDIALERGRYRVMEAAHKRYQHHRSKGDPQALAVQKVETEFFLRPGGGQFYCGLYSTFIMGMPPINRKIDDLTFKSTGVNKLAHLLKIIQTAGNTLTPSQLNISDRYVELLITDSQGHSDWYDLRELSNADVKSIQVVTGNLVMN